MKTTIKTPKLAHDQQNRQQKRMNKVSGVTACRISGSKHMITVLDLGMQALTGVFPKKAGTGISRGPLQLAWCPESGLLQLKHSEMADGI